MPESENQPRLMPMGDAVTVLQQTYPDVTHSSLRFLEREGLIIPQRTRGGHRLFAPTDLSRIRLIKRWQASRLSLEEIRQRLAQMDALEAPAALANHFLEHAIRGDMAGATQVVLLADDLGMPLDRMFEQVLAPVLFEVGSRWEAGSLSVGQEHEISHLMRELIANLTLRHWSANTGSPVILAATTGGEQHDLGLRMVVGLLRQQGAHVHYLGPNVSSDILIDAIRNRRPEIVLLSISIERHLPELHRTLDALAASDFGEPLPAVLVGGQGTLPLAQDGLTYGTVLPTNLCIQEVIDRIITSAPSETDDASALDTAAASMIDGPIP